jgi:hypothetical protein
MKRKHTVKWVTFVAVVLVLAVASTGMADEPQLPQPSAISCGDSATCNMGTPAVQVVNNGTGEAIWGQSTTAGTGVRGISRQGIGVRGQSNIGAGVAGKSITWAGVQADSTSGHALRATSSTGHGVYAVSADLDGVRGLSTGGGIADNGVYGQTNSTDGFEGGLYGYSTSYASGVIGISVSGAGAYLEGAVGVPDLVLGAPGTFDDGDLWCDPNKNDCDIFLRSNDEVWVNLDESNDTAASFIIFNGANAQVFRVDETSGIYGDWTNQDADTYFRVRDILSLDLDDTNDSTYNGVLWVRDETDNVEFWVNTFGDASLDNSMYIGGNLSVGGTKSSVADTSEGRRLLYALESPENWFEDFGSAQLVDGAAIVNIDALFLETVNTGVAYHVYLTPLGDCNGLYVANKTPTSFEVHELGGGTSSIAFDYRIVAKRLGYEEVRLAEAEELDEDGIVGYDETDPVVGSEVDDELPTPNVPDIIDWPRSEESQ